MFTLSRTRTESRDSNVTCEMVRRSIAEAVRRIRAHPHQRWPCRLFTSLHPRDVETCIDMHERVTARPAERLLCLSEAPDGRRTVIVFDSTTYHYTADDRVIHSGHDADTIEAYVFSPVDGCAPESIDYVEVTVETDGEDDPRAIERPPSSVQLTTGGRPPRLEK